LFSGWKGSWHFIPAILSLFLSKAAAAFPIILVRVGPCLWLQFFALIRIHCAQEVGASVLNRLDTMQRQTNIPMMSPTQA